MAFLTDAGEKLLAAWHGDTSNRCDGNPQCLERDSFDVM
jgi:hypothetical protein